MTKPQLNSRGLLLRTKRAKPLRIGMSSKKRNDSQPLKGPALWGERLKV